MVQLNASHAQQAIIAMNRVCLLWILINYAMLDTTVMPVVRSLIQILHMLLMELLCSEMFALLVTNAHKVQQLNHRVKVDTMNQEMHQLPAKSVQLVTTVHSQSQILAQK